MVRQKRPKVPTMHGPAIYRIVVRGRLDRSWSDRFSGMQITQARGINGGPETILVGRISDQAALAGILNELYEQHFPVISADCLDSENDDQ